jgi:hypothetical protein
LVTGNALGDVSVAVQTQSELTSNSPLNHRELSNMKTRFATAWALLTALSATVSTRAAEPDFVLNLVPRDAAAFIHIRAGDIWKHDSFKAVRTFLTKTEPRALPDLEKSFGFQVSDVETLTLLFPEFSARHGLDAPLVVLHFEKPYDKAKLLAAMKALTPSQSHDWARGGEMGGSVGVMYPPTKIKGPYGPPKAKIDDELEKPSFDPPFKAKELDRKKFVEPGTDKLPPPRSVPQQLKDDLSQVAFKAPPDEEPVSEFDRDRFPGRSMPKPDRKAWHYVSRNNGTHLFIVDDRTIVLAEESRRDDNDAALTYCVQMLRRAEHGPLDGAIAEAMKKRTLVAGVNVAALAKTLPETLPPGLERFKVLLSAKAAVLSLDLGEELRATLTVEAGNTANAKKIEDALHAFVGTAKEALPGLKKDAKKSAMPDLLLLLLEQAEKSLAKIEIEQKDTFVRASTSANPDKTFAAALEAAMIQVKTAAERSMGQNRLKQLAIAVHCYHDAYGQLPFPGTDKNGGPLRLGMNPNLSWRVAILPFIEEQNLYQQFKLDEPWDSEHNKKLIAKMPKIYAPLNNVRAEKGHTFYQIFTGRDALQPAMTLLTFTDGTANTLMIVESGDAVPWTRPEDMLYDAKKPLPKLGGLFGGGFNAAFADGAVRWIPKDIPEKVLRALITPSGGEVIDWDWGR